MVEFAQTILVAVFGGFLGSLMTLIGVRWSTHKNVKAAEERLRTELLYEERKKALRELYRLVEQRYKTYKEFKATVSAFLKGFESEFLAVELKNAIQNKFLELDRFLEQRGLALPTASDEEINSWVKEYDEYFRELPEWERAQLEFKDRLSEAKSSIKGLIRQDIKP